VKKSGILALLTLVMLDISAGGCDAASVSMATPSESAPPAAHTPQATVRPSGSPTESPTETSTQQSTSPGPSVWSAGEASALPLDIDFSYPTALSSLPAGLYVLDEDEPSSIAASAIGTTYSAQLLGYSDQVRAWQLAGGRDTAMLMVQGPDPAVYVIDLDRQEAEKVGPLCEANRVFPSPSGDLLALLCRPGDDAGPTVQLVSLSEGLSRRLPFALDGWRFGNRQIFWGGDEWFVSDIGSGGEPCTVRIDGSAILCSPTLGPDQLRGVSPDGKWVIALRLIPRSAFIRSVYPMECLQDRRACEELVMIEDVSSILEWSPDATKLAVISGSGLGSDEVDVGFYEVDTWSFQSLASFKGDYLFAGWCPGSECFLIEPTKPTTKPSVLVFLNGRIDQIPVASPMGVIEVP